MNSNGSFDAELQRELDEALGDMSLFDLADDSPTPSIAAGGGDIRRGTVVAVHGDDILVELGQKSTGLLPLKQLGDEPMPGVGDPIEVTVVGFNENEGLLMLSRKDAVMAAAWETLQVGQSVEGVVTGHNKGGLELKINAIAAFMPISQIDLARVDSEDLGSYVHRKLRCTVVEFNRGEKKLVVSHRSILEAEAAVARKALFESLVEGQRVTGTVRTITPYGAFVDIGGADGLLHVQDMGHGRVADPRSVVREGQQLELMVLRIDREEQKIALGLKQIMADPWEDAENKWPVDSFATGRVTRLMDFGAFVELTEGVEGLVPISEISYTRRIHHPRELLSEGAVIQVRVLSIDREQKRIALSVKRVEEDPWRGATVRWPADTVIEGPVTRIADFGAFVELTPGVEGLIHISELAENRVHKVAEVVKEGDRVQARVLDVDEDKRRISLSIKKLAAMADYTGVATEEAAPETTSKKRKKTLKGGLDWLAH